MKLRRNFFLPACNSSFSIAKQKCLWLNQHLSQAGLKKNPSQLYLIKHRLLDSVLFKICSYIVSVSLSGILVL